MKSIWLSKSFLTGLGAIIIPIAMRYGVEITQEVIEGVFGLIGLILIGKSVDKRIIRKD